MRNSISSLAAKPVRARFYRAADCLLRVSVDDERVARLCERFIGDYCLAPVVDAPSGVTFISVEIKSPESRPAFPDGVAAREIVDGSYVVAGETIYLEIDDSLIVIGPRESAVIRVWIGETRRAVEPLSLATVLSYAINAAMRRRGRFELHAAGLVEPASGKGALIIGDSGSGKTTLTMRLASGGWRYLSDDRLLLGEDAEGIVAWGWRRAFSLTEETLEACAMARLNKALLAQAVNDPGKRHIEPRVVFPHSFISSCQPQALFFTKLVGEAESRVVKLSPSEAMTKLLRQCPWSCYDPATSSDHLRALARLTRQSRAYQLLAGRDLLREPERAAALLGTYLN
ncbi:MAG: hypothetical protein HONDAALG_02106 [Gammaproteobacteria bacterium]|nr:hypothetical protein [Gammaproteobacteria bacterium]